MRLKIIAKSKYQDNELIKMLFDNERTETLAINYILEKNKRYISKLIYKSNGTQNEINTVLNDGLVILINNIKAAKFKAEGSIHSYYIGICKLLWKRTQAKSTLYLKRNVALEDYTEKGDYSELIERFEQQNENSRKLDLIFSLLTEKCREVLDFWARGYSMNEIKDKMGYKNSQIAMNKKNTCLKHIVEEIKKRKG